MRSTNSTKTRWRDLLEDSSEAPFIRLVNMIRAGHLRAGASDIHIEPYRDVSRVRFRLDGVLYGTPYP